MPERLSRVVHFTARRSNTGNGLLSTLRFKLWYRITHTRAHMHKHTLIRMRGWRGGGWGLGGGCRLAVLGGEGGLGFASHPWPLIPTVTERSRWRTTKSSDTDGISANDAPNPQSKTNRGEDGRTACLLCPSEEVVTSEIFTSNLLVLVCAPGLHRFSHLPGCLSYLECGNIQNGSISQARVQGWK